MFNLQSTFATTCGIILQVEEKGKIIGPHTSANLVSGKTDLQAPDCKMFVHIIDRALYPCLP